VNIPFGLLISVTFDSRHLLPLSVGSSGLKRTDFPVIDLTVEITGLHRLYGEVWFIDLLAIHYEFLFWLRGDGSCLKRCHLQPALCLNKKQSESIDALYCLPTGICL
jgi:hypothetical protein